MGKDGLWDDSALIKAFDDAISKYKIMHGKGGHDGSFREGKTANDAEKDLSVLVDETDEATSHTEADDNNIAALKNTIEIGETTNPSLIEENRSKDSPVNEQHLASSNGQHIQDADKVCLSTQGAEDYNNLLNQYYELEKQKQKVLEQLYQFGNWDYQNYGSSVQGCAPYVSQEHQVPTYQASCPTVICSCQSYVCPFSTAPCTCVGQTCDPSATAQNGSSVSRQDGDFIKSAMGAVERAVSTLNAKASGSSEVNKEKERDKEIETDVAELAECRKSETDLTVVLNAWFSAGFYTGKYLTEQSKK